MKNPQNIDIRPSGSPKDTRWRIAKIFSREVFKFSSIGFFILLALDFIFPGLISTVVNFFWLTPVIILSGLLYSLTISRLPYQSAQNMLSSKDRALLVLGSIFIALVIFFKFNSYGPLIILIAILTGGLTLLISFYFLSLKE